jgi:DNA-directed RNA polymerase subunit omega
LTENNVIDSKYRLILMAAKRARQLQGGAKPLVHTTAHKHTRVALEELKAGVLKFEYQLPVGPETVPKEPSPPPKGKR